MRRAPGISLAELLDTVDGVSADDAHALIVAGDIYVDPRRAPLAEPERVPVFQTRELAEAYTIRTRTRAELV